MALWNFTIDDSSPYLTYGPYSDGFSPEVGWQTWYSGSGYDAATDSRGVGDSYHVTSLGGAYMSLQFYGTAIALNGATNSSYDVIIDNIAYPSQTPAGNVLYSNNKLSEGTHYVTLMARSSNTAQKLAFDSAVVASPVAADESLPIPQFYDNTDLSTLAYEGSWSTATANGVPNTTISAPFQETTASGASMTMSITNAHAISVKGMLSSGTGTYSVSMDGVTSYFNGSSRRILPDALLFFRAGLDPSKTHTFNMTNLLSGKKLSINSVAVYKQQLKNSGTGLPGNSSSSALPSRPSDNASVNLGVIIGPIVGVLIICLAGGLFWWRRRSQPNVPSLSQDTSSSTTAPKSYTEGHQPPPACISQTPSLHPSPDIHAAESPCNSRPQSYITQTDAHMLNPSQSHFGGSGSTDTFQDEKSGARLPRAVTMAWSHHEGSSSASPSVSHHSIYNGSAASSEIGLNYPLVNSHDSYQAGEHIPMSPLRRTLPTPPQMRAIDDPFRGSFQGSLQGSVYYQYSISNNEGAAESSLGHIMEQDLSVPPPQYQA